MNQLGDMSRGGGSPLRGMQFGAGQPATAPRMVKPPAIRFSGFSTTGSVDRAMIPTFQKFTEVFLYNFLGLDLFFIWLPRFFTALTTGAVPYNPKDDPKAKDKPLHKQAGMWAVNNVKGLNWANLDEETKREIASGPGTLAVSVLTFLAVRHIWHKRPMELSFPAIEGLSQGFEQHPPSDESQAEHGRYRKALAGYVDSIFVDPAMRSAAIHSSLTPEQLKDVQVTLKRILKSPEQIEPAELARLQSNPLIAPLLSDQPGLKKQMRGLLSRQSKSGLQPELSRLKNELEFRPMLAMLQHHSPTPFTYDDYLRQWSEKWSEVALSRVVDHKARKQRIHKLDALNKDLSNAMELFNRSHRMEHYETLSAEQSDTQRELTRYIHDDKPLHNTKKAWIRYAPSVHNVTTGKTELKHPEQKTLAELTSDLSLWGDFAENVWRDHQKKPDTDLGTIVDKLRKKMVAQKFGIGVTATGLAGLYMIHLAYWCQSHDSYQATRTLKKGVAGVSDKKAASETVHNEGQPADTVTQNLQTLPVLYRGTPVTVKNKHQKTESAKTASKDSPLDFFRPHNHSPSDQGGAS